MNEEKIPSGSRNTSYLLLGVVMFIFGVGMPNFVSDAIFVVFSLFIVNYRDVLERKFFVLFLFSFSYVFIDYGNLLSSFSLVNKVDFVVVSLASYLVGRKICLISSGAPTRVITLFFVMQIGWAFFGGLSVYFTVMHDPMLLLSRHLLNYFGGEGSELHALYMAASFVVVMASVPFLLYWLFKRWSEIPWHQKVLFIVTIVVGGIGALINNVLQNRSPFAIVVLTALLPIFFLPRISENLSKLNYALALLVTLIAIACVLSYLGFGTDDFLSNGVSSRLDREELSTNGRADVWLLGLEMIPQYPLGGIIMPPGYESTEGYFHNFWLDVAKISGYVPLLLILIFQLAHVRGILIVLLGKFTFEYGIITIFLVCIAFMYLTEPIHQLMPQFHYFTLMLFGYLSMLQKQTKLTRRIRL